MAEGTTGEEHRRVVTRRTILVSATAVGVAAAGAGIAAGSGAFSSTPVLRKALGVAGGTAVAQGGVVKIDRVFSQARNRRIDLVTMFPDGGPRQGMPMCLMLHGLGGTARAVPKSGLPDALSIAVARKSVPPFGFVAVDGGDNYWHCNHPGDDPLAMLLEEVPRWLAERNLGGQGNQPFAVTGISMGGFGAFLYARRRKERNDPVRALGVISPALLTDWNEMAKRHAFHDAADWGSMDPMKNLDKLGNAPIGVWSGSQDRFIQGTRKFIDEVKPQIASITPGQHNNAYYRKATPDMIRFVGRYVPDTIGAVTSTAAPTTPASS